MQYQLTIDIDPQGVQNIYNSGQTITIVKSVNSSPLQSGNLPVAWIAFQPLETNVVTWEENYSIYATTTQLQSGATIQMSSTTSGSVQQGWLYTLAGGIFTGTTGGGATTFNAGNAMSQHPFSFGLAQQTFINNVATTAPLNAIPVLYNESVSFTPLETISLFLSSYSNNGVVISQVAGNALVVTLSSQTPSAAIGFNDATNSFFQQSTAKLLDAYDFAKRLSAPAR
ncbi:MAG: hypothetical protein JO083_05980 [Candidatus Eremiobacteraeota bacterium]|nr:hypothetical protein [Candidatus Eremiobacteraeota bacterium]